MRHAFLAAACTALLAACATPQPTGPVAVKILAINDFHGNLRPPLGGIRTVADAAAYIALTQEHLGEVGPTRFRIGASGLLNNIEAVLGGGTAAPTQGY